LLGHQLTVEFVGTLILVFTVGLSTSSITGAFAVAKTTWGTFNLAVALGGGVTAGLTSSQAWIYIVASLLGGAGAATLCACLHPSCEALDRPLLVQVPPDPDSQSVVVWRRNTT
jgi:glycerol uptake facilitator-like aquaporin